MTISKQIDYVTTFSTQFYESAKDAVIIFVRKNARRLSALSMAGKMLSLIILFAVMPISIKPLNKPVYETNVQFNKENPVAIVAYDKKVNMEVGESEFDKTEREKQANVYQTANYRDVAISYHSDPTEFRPIYQAAAAQFGIPWQLLEAVHEVESGKSGSTDRGSYAGACGPMQFMPGTWRTYGVDGNGDGTADITDVVDAIYGAAHLLARSGADEGRIDDALFNYNHAQWYVDKVKAIAYEIGM